MEATGDHQTKWSKSERVRQTLNDISYLWNLKCDIDESMMQKQTHKYREQIFGCQGWEGWEREELQVWDQWMQTSIYRMDKQQGPNV